MGKERNPRRVDENEAFAVNPYAAEIAGNPTEQVNWAKQLIYSNAANDNLRSVLQSEDEIFRQAGQTEARREAAIAFREKREPEFHREGGAPQA